MSQNRFLFAVVFFCFAHTGWSQFFALVFDSLKPYVTALPYPGDGKYRVVSFDQRFQSNPLNRVSIKVYDQTLQYEKTITLLKGITLVNDYPPLLKNGKLFWPANFCDTIAGNLNWFVVLQLDSNYSHVAMHKLTSHSNVAKPTGIVAHPTGFIVGEYFDTPNDPISSIKTKLFLLSETMQIKDSALFNDELRIRNHTTNKNKIICASDNLKPMCTTSAQVTQKIVLDTNLSVATCMDLPVNGVYFCYDGGGNMIGSDVIRIRHKGIILPISDIRDYAQGPADRRNCPELNENWIINSMTLKSDKVEQNFENEHRPENTNFPLYYSSNFDLKGRNIVYVGSIGRINNPVPDKPLHAPYFEKELTRLLVTKTDTAGNLLWNHEFGTGMNYFGRSVAFTADGGCVIAGTRYDSTTMFGAGVFENFLLKLNKNGEIFSAGLADHSRERVTYHYPNPVTSTARFNFPSGTQFTLQFINSLGEIAGTNRNYMNGSAIEINDLAPGFYIYIAESDKETFLGKLLIQK